MSRPLRREATSVCSAATLLRARRARAGFTLMELMVVVVIVGVLAALATYGVRKYTLQAKKAEAVTMLTQIRGAEEAYRDETFEYLGLEDFEVWHPTSEPDTSKRGWSSKDTDQGTKVLKPLGVLPNGGVLYSYAVVAGPAGGKIPTIPTVKTWDFPEPTAPFYIAMAKGDLNGDGTYTYALTHSDSDEVYVDETF